MAQQEHRETRRRQSEAFLSHARASLGSLQQSFSALPSGQEELASAEALPAPDAAVPAAASDDSNDRTPANPVPTGSVAELADTAPAADHTQAAEVRAEESATVHGAHEAADEWPGQALAAEAAKTQDAEIAALHRELYDVLQQVVKLEREKAAAEADKLALGQRLEREWEAREAAEAAVLSAAEAAARASARECAALQEALDQEREKSSSTAAARKEAAAQAAELEAELAEKRRQVALLQKENKSVSDHLKAAQSARAAAQRAASQLREENTALAEGQDRATVGPTAADHAECEARLVAALREASRLQAELAASERAKRGLEVGVREVEDALNRTEQRVAEAAQLKVGMAAANAEKQRLKAAQTRLAAALAATEAARDAATQRAEDLARRLEVTEEEVMVLGQSLRQAEAAQSTSASEAVLEQRLAAAEAQRSAEAEQRGRAEEAAVAAAHRAREAAQRWEQADQQAAAAASTAEEERQRHQATAQKLAAAEILVREERTAREDAERRAALAQADLTAERQRRKKAEARRAADAAMQTQPPALIPAVQGTQPLLPSEAGKLVSHPIAQSLTESTAGHSLGADNAQQGVSKAARVLGRLSLSRRSPQPMPAAAPADGKASDQPAAIEIRAGADPVAPPATSSSGSGNAGQPNPPKGPSAAQPSPAPPRPRQAARAALGAVGNPQMIKNAVTRLCLPGPGKENERAEVLALIDGKGASSRLMLLIRGSNSFAYRGLYAVDSDKETLVKLHGRGPEAIEQAAVRAFFRYDSSARELRPLSRGPSFGAAHAVAIAPPQPRPSSAGSS